jgi:regulator of protease activity HflC (stomatin/prohibitin superfamily)
MALIIIGIIAFIVGLAMSRGEEIVKRFAAPTRSVGLLLVLIGVLIACIVQVEAGEIGVKKLFGKVEDDVLPSGLHFINPLMDVEKMDVKTQNYTMSGVHDEGSKQGDDAIRALTSDGLEVIIDITVLYKVLPSEAPKLIKETGLDDTDKICRPVSRTKSRDNAFYYEAGALYSTKRDEFQLRIFKSIDEDFKKRGLILEQLLVRNITLPQAVKTSIEQKISAEQEAQKMQFVLQKERQEAERKRVEAQGIADYQHIISESLTDKQLQYEQIKAMKEFAATELKMIIMGKGGPGWSS